MHIKTFQGGFDKNLTYLLWCRSTQIAALVDASVDTTAIVEYIDFQGLVLEKIFITHTHFDHIKYLEDLKYQFPQVQICGHPHPEEKLSNNYRSLNHREIIPVGTEMFTALHTPGHYPDSLCFWNKKEEVVFTGDTMFVGRSGRTVSAKSNISHLYNSLYSELLPLPKETRIYPGHHYGYTPSVTLKENKTLSPFFQCETEAEFIQVMEEFEKNRRTR